jgi:hypothetical protein
LRNNGTPQKPIRSPYQISGQELATLPSKLICFGEASLRQAIIGFLTHYHYERNRQGKVNELLFPSPVSPP